MMASPPGPSRRAELPGSSGSTAETLLIIAAVIAALYLGRGIAIPVAIAVLIAFSLGPAFSWLRRRGCGRFPAIFVAVVPALLAVASFAYVVTTEVGRLAQDIPSYQTNIEAKMARLRESLPTPAAIQRGSALFQSLARGTPAEKPVVSAAPVTRGRPRTDAPTSQLAGPLKVQIENPEPGLLDIFRGVLGPLIEPLASAALVLLFVIFFLAERETLRDRIIRLAGARDLHRTTMAMDEAAYRVSRFLLHQSAVNAVFGGAIALGLYLIGLPNAALWGGIAAILRFIPYLGTALAAVLPLLLAFAVDPGWTMLLWTGGIFLGLELVVGNFLEPWLYVSSTGLSSVALLISAIFWTWLWGTIGLLLATPLTVCIAVVGRYVPQLAFLHVLLGNQAPLKPEEAFYQRLLAGHPDEAIDQAEDVLKAGSFVDFCDAVAIPALRLAEHDRARGALAEDRLEQVVGTLKIVLVDLEAGREKGPGPEEPSDEADEEGDVILCVAGRTDLDHAAAMLMAQALESEGRRVVTLAADPGHRAVLPDLAANRIKLVLLSYLDPESGPHARYLSRRYRRQVGPEAALMVAFWGMDARDPTTDPRIEVVVTSVQAALTAIDAEPAANHAAAVTEPDLRELAMRVSAMVTARD